MLTNLSRTFALPGVTIRLGLLAGLLLMLVPVQAQNTSVSLDLNDDALRLTGHQIQPERQITYGGSIFNHQDRGLVVTGDFHITGNAATSARPITAGLGGRIVNTSVDDDFGEPDDILPMPPVSSLFPDQSGYALAIGGFFKGQVPNYDRIGFGGHLYFAPDVLAFGDMEEYTDLWLYGSYSVLRNGDVYVGVRSLKSDFNVIKDFSFDTGVHAGFTLKF